MVTILEILRFDTFHGEVKCYITVKKLYGLSRYMVEIWSMYSLFKSNAGG